MINLKKYKHLFVIYYANLPITPMTYRQNFLILYEKLTGEYLFKDIKKGVSKK